MSAWCWPLQPSPFGLFAPVQTRWERPTGVPTGGALGHLEPSLFFKARFRFEVGRCQNTTGKGYSGGLFHGEVLGDGNNGCATEGTTG